MLEAGVFRALRDEVLESPCAWTHNKPEGTPMKQSSLEIHHDTIAEFCRRHHISRLALFGSVLRPDFGPGSDVDVLVTFEPEYIPGFLRMHVIEQELSDLLGGRRVDLVTEKFLNRRLRDQILATAEVQYAAG